MARFFRVTLLILLLSAGLSAAGVIWLRAQLFEPFQSDSAPVTRLDIPTGQNAQQILNRLERAGVLPNARVARLYLVYRLGDPPLKAGEYEFREPLAATEVLERLIRGDVITHPVTIVEGLTLEETATALERAGFGPRESFLKLMRSPEMIADIDSEAASLEGYLFPETYRFARDTRPEEIVSKLVQTFRDRYDASVAPLLAGTPTGPSTHEVVTLASIVEKEAALDDERPIIAAVYRNRLDRGIALYADPTVIYALQLENTWNGNLTRKDLQIESPYNTYRYPGLPPGPICSPGLASLRAAARPADVPYLYFVSRNDGSHVFATTLREHNRNVAEWQKRYWRRRWAEERRKDVSNGHD